MCCFWARNITENWEKWKMSGTCWSRACKQLSFGTTVCFNGSKTSNVWHPIRTRCFVSRPRLDGTDGNHWYISWAPYQLIIWFAYSSLSIIRKSLYCSFMARKLYALALEKCAAESADSPMMQEVLLGGHLYLMSLKVGQDTVKFRK